MIARKIAETLQTRCNYSRVRNKSLTFAGHGDISGQIASHAAFELHTGRKCVFWKTSRVNQRAPPVEQGPLMKSALLSAVLVVLGAVSVPVHAEDRPQGDGTARSKVKPARLIEFTGDREFLKQSSRLRVWRGEVGYTLEVDSAGTPTDCRLTEEFRMNYVNDKLCEVLIKHHNFEPAQDASGALVEGSYEGRLNFLEMRERE